MSRRNKLEKFAELHSLPNVYENMDPDHPGLTASDGQATDLRGKWAEVHFKNQNPICLELACGRGEYTLGLARMFPERNFIGVDIKGARMWKGAQIALEENLGNAAFLRTRIEQINHFFAPDEVDEIWITFPDPFLRESKSNRRLTSQPFLNRFSQFLKPGGLIHLKTDSAELFDFTLEVLAAQERYQLIFQDTDIYAKPLPFAELDLQTYYEKMHLENGKNIKYVRFEKL